MVEVVHTNFAPFSQTLKIFLGVWAPIVAPPSDDFQIIFPQLESTFSPKNATNIIKIGLQMQTLSVIILTQLRHRCCQSAGCDKKKWKTKVFVRPLTPTCIVRFPPILQRWSVPSLHQTNFFLDPISSLARGHQTFGWKCPHQVIFL